MLGSVATRAVIQPQFANMLTELDSFEVNSTVARQLALDTFKRGK